MAAVSYFKKQVSHAEPFVYDHLYEVERSKLSFRYSFASSHWLIATVYSF